MKRECRLIKAYGVNDVSLADLPHKISNVQIARVLFGEEMGCSRCFPHGYETVNNRMSKEQRSWKVHRKKQWR